MGNSKAWKNKSDYIQIKIVYMAKIIWLKKLKVKEKITALLQSKGQLP